MKLHDFVGNLIFSRFIWNKLKIESFKWDWILWFWLFNTFFNICIHCNFNCISFGGLFYSIKSLISTAIIYIHWIQSQLKYLLLPQKTLHFVLAIFAASKRNFINEITLINGTRRILMSFVKYLFQIFM